ncbi:MAG TPA: hypothetical protein VHY48_02085 [Acidobacteriaceae bacterium]|jgi:hypothetical protein|nr:hypothetical protein [Acidobacteriaceae bacterium]
MRRGLVLVALIVGVLGGVTAFAQVTTTTVQDTVYRADGTAAGGTVLVSWPTFTTALGNAVAAGTTATTLGPNGSLTLALTPNAGAMPTGSYYTAVFHLDDGTMTKQYWVIPVSATPVTLASIESQVLPASVAMQTVSKAYVDAAIAQAVSGGTQGGGTQYVPTTGGTMTGPLVLPADPVSPNQASDKHYVDTNVTALTGGMAGKVSLVPTTTQTVAQPVGTQLQVNVMNGALYASQFPSGDGNNGIANALTSTACTTGCLVKVDPSYASGEPVIISEIPQAGHVVDERGGADVETFVDPVNVQVSESWGEMLEQISTRTDANSQYTGATGTDHVTLSLLNEGLTGGSNQLPGNVENPPYGKSTYGVTTETGSYYTQGQHVQNTNNVNCYGVGDCLAGGQFITSSGGYRDIADEGAHPFDLQVTEDYRVFQGTCSSGCATGSTSVNVTASSGGGTEGDGRYLIDKNPAKVLSTGAIVGEGGDLFNIAQFSGTGFPVSTFLLTAAAATSQAKNLSPGTVTLPIATSGLLPAFSATTAGLPSTGVACVADSNVSGQGFPDFETANYAVVDATHITLTLNKVHGSGAVIAVGGLCGYGLEQTVDTFEAVRQVFPVIGSLSATSLYYANALTPVIGNGSAASTSGYQNLTMPVASIARANNVVTVTLTANMPQDVNGLTLTVSGVADTSYDGSFAVTTTGGKTLTYAQSGTNSSSSGGTLTLLTGGFDLYPMAEVLSVYDPASRAVDGLLTLAPNTVAWAQGDAVEEPHFYQQSTFADTEYVTQYVPRPIQYVSAGKQYQGEVGPGVRGWEVTNQVAASNYIGGGGTHEPPDDAYMANGVWNTDFEVDAGALSLLRVHCNWHGCNRWDSGYSLFALDAKVGEDFLFYNPSADSASWILGGQTFSFAPTGFTANTITATNVNASSFNGPIGNTTPSTGNFSSVQFTSNFPLDNNDHNVLTMLNGGTQMIALEPSGKTLGGGGAKIELGDGVHPAFIDFYDWLEMGTDNGTDFVWSTNSGSYTYAERMRIKQNGTTLLGENGGSVVIGSSTPAGLFSVGSANQFQVDGSGDVKVRQLSGSGASPTVSAGSAAGSGASATVAGTLISGVLNLTTGTATSASAALLNVSWTISAPAAPQGCSLMPRNAAAAAVSGTIYTGAPSTSGWVVNVGATALAASTAYAWSYQCF